MAVHARVLRIARSDAEVETSLLLHVSSNGPSSLDLQLVATEGVHPYVGSVQHGRVSALRAKNAMVTDDEWETVLSTLLRSSGRDQEARRGIEGVEMTASVTEGVDATVTIRKNVGGITQRLGTISLGHDEAQEIELFDWAGLAAEEASSARVDVMALMTRYRAQEKQVQQLTRQLDDLIKAKKEHEDTLLQKCRELLNRKKLKIRDQQRLLQGAILDPVRAAEVGAARAPLMPHVLAPSRPAKRKSETDGMSRSDGDDLSDAYRSHFDDAVDDEGRETRVAQPTPDRSEDGTTEDESEQEDKVADTSLVSRPAITTQDSIESPGRDRVIGSTGEAGGAASDGSETSDDEL